MLIYENHIECKENFVALNERWSNLTDHIEWKTNQISINNYLF